jgi:hypothetical protein
MITPPRLRGANHKSLIKSKNIEITGKEFEEIYNFLNKNEQLRNGILQNKWSYHSL